MDESPSLLSDAIKKLLDLNGKKKGLADHSKQLRNEMKVHMDQVMNDMSTQGLRVVRVMQHHTGPHDITFQSRSKRPSMSKVHVKQALLKNEFSNKPITPELVDEIMELLLAVPEDVEQTHVLSIKRLKVSDKKDDGVSM